MKPTTRLVDLLDPVPPEVFPHGQTNAVQEMAEHEVPVWRDPGCLLVAAAFLVLAFAVWHFADSHVPMTTPIQSANAEGYR